jgi:threonine dehydrogenase-like Zn-dependent dehydrogenase
MAGVQEVDEPVPAAGQLLVDVERVGVCGTDIELYTGEMAYIHLGRTHFPLRLGHEWTGRVAAVGPDTDETWIGSRIVGDTMLGCGVCEYCRAGTHWVCPDRFEVGVLDGWPGALAQQLVIPARFAHLVPETVNVAAAAMVEPAGNSLRAVDAAALPPGGRLLVIGAGTIGLLAAQFALARGWEVHVAGTRPSALALAAALGVRHSHPAADLAAEAVGRFDAVIDATSIDSTPALAARLVKPAGRVILIGLSSTPSLIDTRELALGDITAVGILSASPGLVGAIEHFASGAVNPEPLVSETVGLDEVASRLEGRRGIDAGPGPKVHVDPRR